MMRKSIILASAALALVSCSPKKNSTESENSSQQTVTDSISAGHFEVKNLNGFRLHIYLTEDNMGDASFIIEGNDSLVTLEQPLFKVNASAFNQYVDSLGKPVAHRIADFHLGNTGSDTIIMPQGMPEVVKGDAYSGMMNHFAEIYGDAIEPLPTGVTREVEFGKTIVLGGVPFTFLKGADNDFPGANILIGTDAVYSHWAPAKAHINNLYAGNIQGIDARIGELELILSTGANVFVGGHGMPATADDVKFLISYLNKIKELMAANGDAATFAAALIDAYPNLPGADGVEALAQSLYSDKQ